jgi:hypothetical protein
LKYGNTNASKRKNKHYINAHYQQQLVAVGMKMMEVVNVIAAVKVR